MDGRPQLIIGIGAEFVLAALLWFSVPAWVVVLVGLAGLGLIVWGVVDWARSGDKLRHPKRAVRKLREWANEKRFASVQSLTDDRRPLAAQIAETFALAGWNYDALDALLVEPSFDGVRVAGYDAILVGAVAEAFKAAGVKGVLRVVNPMNIPPDAPAYDSAPHMVWITVGRG